MKTPNKRGPVPQNTRRLTGRGVPRTRRLEERCREPERWGPARVWMAQVWKGRDALRCLAGGQLASLEPGCSVAARNSVQDWKASRGPVAGTWGLPAVDNL